MSEKLSETQLLLLNNLIYRDEFVNLKYDDDTVGNILKEVSNSPQQTLTKEEWDAIYEMAKSDPAILNLKVTNMSSEEATGAKMACFVDEDGQAYAVFAGTGANEWRDDCVAGTMADSPQQQKAKAWLDSLPYDNLIVSGHSKGGNKAMYVAVTSDKVLECYAFDGEGFSQEFCLKYADRIKQMKNNIHLRANYRDFVNVLLINIAGDAQYITNDTDVANAGEYHAPNALFKYEKGKIVYSIGEYGADAQDPAMKMLHEFTEYLLENATETEKIVALSVLGEILTKFLGGEKGVVREDIIAVYGIEAGEIILRYLTKYIQKLRISNPLKYHQYRLCVGDFAKDAAGGDFWGFLLGNIALEPISKELLFDNLANGKIETIYRYSEMFAGGNIQGRDFSQSTKDTMIGAAKETEDEKWWQVTKWDCWYKVENFFGALKLDNYTGCVDDYYRKLIDINDTSVKEIEKIFEDVYRIDGNYADKMSQSTERLNSNVLSKLTAIRDSIHVEGE